MTIPIKQRPARPFKRVVTIILAWLIFTLLPADAVQQKGEVSLANQLKAAFVFNFINFVEWPEEVIGRSPHMDICVLGFDDVGEAINSLEGREVKGKKLKIRSLGGPDEIRDCHILYVQISEKENMRRIMNLLKERPILSIADFDNFSNGGGMITLTLVQNRVRFIINNHSAKKAGLKISSKLLNLAIEVID